MPRSSCSRPPQQVTDDGIDQPDGSQRADQLEYIADLSLELKEMADSLGCPTLAAVLGAAYREAIVQAGYE